MRSLIIEKAFSNGATIEDIQANDPGWKFILPLLQEQGFFANNSESSFGFPVMNGEPVPDKFIKVIAVPEEALEVVLASDGFPRIGSTLALSKEYLAGVLNRDPLMYKEMRETKGLKKGNISFDDATYIRFAL
jgi:hypothetical protein